MSTHARPLDLYELAGFNVAGSRWIRLPRMPYIVGDLPEGGVCPATAALIAFGRAETNYAANIHGLKAAREAVVLSVSAVGSLREHIRPGHGVADQFIDRTKGRRLDFFGDGVVGHIVRRS